MGEDSIVVIPLWPDDAFNSDRAPDFDQAKRYYLRAMSLSRKGVVSKLKAEGVPESWKQSPLLRNCFPLLLDAEGCWVTDTTVRLDDDLGFVYESKENE
jgi:CRISPR-associated endonuclease/helicase Cas3